MGPTRGKNVTWSEGSNVSSQKGLIHLVHERNIQLTYAEPQGYTGFGFPWLQDLGQGLLVVSSRERT